MFHWLYRTLFYRRVKWVLSYRDVRGDESRLRVQHHGLDAAEVDVVVEKIIRPLINNGWALLSCPRP